MQKILQNFESIAISIAKFQKYCNKHGKISKVLQYLLQHLKVLQYFAILLEHPCILSPNTLVQIFPTIIPKGSSILTDIVPLLVFVKNKTDDAIVKKLVDILYYLDWTIYCVECHTGLEQSSNVFLSTTTAENSDTILTIGRKYIPKNGNQYMIIRLDCQESRPFRSTSRTFLDGTIK